VRLDPVEAELSGISSLRGCNDCDLDLARDLGAEFVAVGWVQKVSNLILNLNLQVRDAATGQIQVVYRRNHGGFGVIQARDT